MKFDIVTIFPQVIQSVTTTGVVGRAVVQGALDVVVHDLRDFATDRHRSVDDVPYGGGPGMVLKLEPFVRALDRIRQDRGEPNAVVLTSPQGVPLSHREAVRLSALDHVVVLCGRYEGVDERVREHLATEELSIGDYVLSGGTCLATASSMTRWRGRCRASSATGIPCAPTRSCAVCSIFRTTPGRPRSMSVACRRS